MLTYQTLPEKVKKYFHRNITMSVAFVKKDGSVRHISFRRNLKSYVKSDAEKSNSQTNMLQNNNLMLVYDTNLYIKALKGGADEGAASKVSYRNFKLENVMVFLCGGELFDLRQENDIAKRFGEGVAGQLTKSMVSAMKKDEDDAMELTGGLAESSLKQFIKETATKLHKKTLLENAKSEILKEIKLLEE